MSESTATPRIADLEHPWLGLESFREDTRDYFFGRDTEIAEIQLRLRTQPLLIVYGRSGLGKTSILRAGLIPQLREAGSRPVVLRLSYEAEAPNFAMPKPGTVGTALGSMLNLPRAVAVVGGVSAPFSHRPTSQIYHALFDYLAHLRALGTLSQYAYVDFSWLQQLKRELPFPLPDDPASLLWLRLHDRKTPPDRTHLILDQFEEVFTLGTDRPGAEKEVREALAILVQGAIPTPIAECMGRHESFLDYFDPDSQPVRVILALRDDYVFALNRWRRHIPHLGQNFFELRPLRGPAAFAAIYEPAYLRSSKIEQEGKLIDATTDLSPLLTKETAWRIARFIREKKGRDGGQENVIPDEEIEVQSPILSLLCRELNQRRFTEPPGSSESPAPEVTFDETKTNVETILQTFYERCLQEAPDAVRIFIEEDLVSYGGIRLQQDEGSMLDRFTGGRAIPNTNPVEIAAGYGDPEKAKACLRKLVSDRLLVAVGNDEGGRYELTHDLLASVVRRSRTAREERLAKRRAEEQLREAERVAEERREEAARVAEAQLKEAARAAEEQKREAARFAEERQKKQSAAARRALFAVILLALFVAGALAIFAWFKRGEAVRQRAEADKQRREAVAAAAKAETAAADASVAAARATAAQADEAIARLSAEVEKTKVEQALAQLEKQSAEVQERLDQARKTLDEQTATVEASKAAIERVDKLEKQLSVRLSQAERLLFAEALRDLRSALTKAQSGEQAASELVETSAKLAAEAVQATRKISTAPRLLAVLSGHEKPITALAFSPDSSQLASTGRDNFVRLWNRAGEKGIEIQGSSRDGINAVAFSPDGQRIAIGSNGSTIHVRHLVSGERYEYQGHSDTITSVSFSADGASLLSSSADRKVRTWNSTGLDRRLGQFNSIVTWAVFDPKGERVLASLDDPDDSAQLLTVQGEAVPRVLKMNAPVKRAIFSPDGTLALTAGSGDKTAAIWETATGKRLQSLSGHKDAVWQAVFNPAGDRIATASDDRTVGIWNVTDGKSLGFLTGHKGDVRHVLFSPDGASVLSGSSDTTARLWPLDDPASSQVLSGHTGPLTAIAFSPDGTRIATGSSDGTVRLWEVASEQTTAPAAGQSGWVLYGYPDRQTPGKFRQRSFSRVSGDPTAIPVAGDLVKAEAHMNIRSSVALRPDGKWDQGRPVGLLRKDSQTKVFEVLGGDQRGEPPMLWIRIDPTAAP